jgi:type IV pilus assembly protein PilW
MTLAHYFPHTVRSKPRANGLQAGFTLIELMVSMVIGLLLVLAMVTMLINVNRNNSEMSKTTRVIENGRFALQLLADDISHAGYWGGFVPQFDDLTFNVVPTDFPTALPDPCLAYASWGVPPYTDLTAVPPVSHQRNLIGIAVQGYEIPSVVPSPTLSVCASRVTLPKASTDVLVVRHLERATNCNPAVLNVAGQDDCPLPVANELYFQMQRCGSTAPAIPYVFDTYVELNDLTRFSLQKRSCTDAAAAATAATQAERRKFVSSLYYVRRFSALDGDNIPTLMRSQFGLSGGVLEHKTADAMIEGVEGFRVEYGIDNLSDTGAGVNFAQAITWANTANLTSPTNRGDGMPDGSYVRCTTASPCTAAQLANAVAVKLYVLVRSENTSPGYTDSKVYCLGSNCPTATATACPAGTPNTAPLLGPFCDGYKRHLFTQTVRLVNVSSRRETP